MTFAITEWNLNPNRNWYVKMADAGSDISIKLYPTAADAVADTNLVAEGTAAFGTGVEAALAMDAAGAPEISLFNAALSYHLKVSGADSDTTKTFYVMPFVDLPDINNSIYRSEALIEKKAIVEINRHTHTAKIRSIGVGNHNPALVTGDVLGVQSTMRGIDVLTTVSERVILATPDSLTDQVETIQY
ncbi:MAG: hypothetical protein JRC90_12125, partial [Deltaproteobacteria bacterium]|nr:hypothetical protein [Deltaproteobacteria bacterium]